MDDGQISESFRLSTTTLLAVAGCSAVAMGGVVRGGTVEALRRAAVMLSVIPWFGKQASVRGVELKPRRRRRRRRPRWGWSERRRAAMAGVLAPPALF